RGPRGDGEPRWIAPRPVGERLQRGLRWLAPGLPRGGGPGRGRSDRRPRPDGAGLDGGAGTSRGRRRAGPRRRGAARELGRRLGRRAASGRARGGVPRVKSARVTRGRASRRRFSRASTSSRLVSELAGPALSALGSVGSNAACPSPPPPDWIAPAADATPTRAGERGARGRTPAPGGAGDEGLVARPDRRRGGACAVARGAARGGRGALRGAEASHRGG